MLPRNFKKKYGGWGADVDPGYRHKLRRKLRPQSMRRRDAVGSFISFCNDGMTFRSVIPEDIFVLARSRSATNLSGAIMARGDYGLEWRAAPELVIRPRCANSLGFSPPCGLVTTGSAIERFEIWDKKKLPNGVPFTRGNRPT